MKIILVMASLILAGTAHAKVPQLNHRCPDISVGMFSDVDGRVYVNAQEADLKAIDADHYTATIPGVVISIAVNRDGSPSVSYTSKGKTGACRAIPPPSEDNG